MDYKKFKELIDKGETQTIDYKIECNAFHKGNEKDTAELVKDIIAFANNGNVASYLIIGVSNDRNGFKSVENDKLTDDNIQVLVRDNIFPIPKVKLYRCTWSKVADFRHKEKTFVIIQVGPQARQCFRFAKDHIGYDKKYCFKRNEIWIRRQATSDLASPEEIKRLLEGKEPISEAPLENNVDYKRLSQYEYKGAIKSDLISFLDNVKGKFRNEDQYAGKRVARTWNIISLNLNGKKINMVVLFTDKCNEKGLIAKVCREVYPLHHGVLLICTGNVSPSSVEWCPIKIKENWGYFCTNYQTDMASAIRSLPTVEREKEIFTDVETFCLALEKVSDTQTLHSKFLQAIAAMTEKEDIKSHLEYIYGYITKCLSEWLKLGCPYKTDKIFDELKPINKRNAKVVNILKPYEFVDEKRFGKIVMARNEGACEVIEEFLK